MDGAGHCSLQTGGTVPDIQRGERGMLPMNAVAADR